MPSGVFYLLIAGIPGYFIGITISSLIAKEAFHRKRFNHSGPDRDDPGIIAVWIIVGVILWPATIFITIIALPFFGIGLLIFNLHTWIQSGYTKELMALEELKGVVVDTKAFLKKTRSRKLEEDIDQWGNKRILWQLSGIYQTEVKPRVLQVTCPTTARIYLLAVRPDHQNCEEAWRWTGRLNPDLTNIQLYES